jgi:ParB/RepB/Spo0J family partition protein
MSKIANIFKAGDPVIIKATATKPNGDSLKQAGKAGSIAGIPSPGRYMVDVPGFPLVNLPADELDHLAAAKVSKEAQQATDISVVTDVVAKGDTPDAPIPQGSAGAAGTPGWEVIYSFEVALILSMVPSLTNPRSYFDPEALKSLSEDIANNGILQPILIRRLPASRLSEDFSRFQGRTKATIPPIYEIVAGERRFRACIMAGVRSVPVLIRELTDEQVLRMQLIENIQRADLHPLEEAQGYRRILDLDSQAGKSMAERQEELAHSIKRSTRYVYQTLQLLKLCDFARQIFLEKKLDRTIALEIAKIGNEPGQIEATRRIAGLGVKGTDVINHPMSHSQAVEYRRNNHALLLADAPFNIKIELAGVEPCGTCPKMSANALDLFEEGAKLHDTCLDRSCYGKKNAAHNEEIAAAAKAKGQKVISGAAAKKLMPHGQSLAMIQGGFEALDSRRYDVVDSKSGNTVRQILGKDMPLPVLIQNPHAAGFIEVLPKAEVTKLLKERGLMDKATVRSDEDKARAVKEKFEKAYRWHWAEQLLINAGKLDDSDLFESLIAPMAAQIYRRLDNECTKRTHKLMGWTFPVFGYDQFAKVLKHFKDMEAGELNKFVIVASVASELHVAQYHKPGSQALDCMGEILNVNGKALKAKMEANRKTMAKAAADIKAKIKPAATVTTSAPTSAAAAPKPSNKTQWRDVAKDETIQGMPRVRIKNADALQKIKQPYAGDVGTLEKKIGAEVWTVLLPASNKKLASISFHHTEFQVEVIAAPTLAGIKQPGDTWSAAELEAMFYDTHQDKIYRPHAVKDSKGKIWSVLGVGYDDNTKPGKPRIYNFSTWHVKHQDRCNSLHAGEAFELTAAEKAAREAAASAAYEAAGAEVAPKKATKKADPASKQASLDLPAPSKSLQPQSAWPFPLKGESKSEAQARIGKDLKGARA